MEGREMMEYRVAGSEGVVSAGDLEKFGQEGWELVTIIQLREGHYGEVVGNNQFLVYLNRRLSICTNPRTDKDGTVANKLVHELILNE